MNSVCISAIGLCGATLIGAVLGSGILYSIAISSPSAVENVIGSSL